MGSESLTSCSVLLPMKKFVKWMCHCASLFPSPDNARRYCQMAMSPFPQPPWHGLASSHESRRQAIADLVASSVRGHPTSRRAWRHEHGYDATVASIGYRWMQGRCVRREGVSLKDGGRENANIKLQCPPKMASCRLCLRHPNSNSLALH